ncbi:MAG: chromosomal replication initiator protein DnaA [Spirochaetia bacterium]|nr:chromosomal replication initiator protein DnaA [Spirochaetia bacterium]
MYKTFWDETLFQIKKEISPEEFAMWFNSMRYLSSKDGILKLSVPSKFIIDQIKNRYLKKLEKKLSEISGTDIKIEFSIQKRETENLSADDDKKIKEIFPAPRIKRKHPDLKEEYTFENFVIGSNNDFAANAAIAISKNPGKAYNPFFIYGGVGLGKTHLIQALGNEIYSTHPEKKIVFVTAEQFGNEFVESINCKKANAFKNKYRTVDVLLIDDIHFFQGKDGMQEELFNTFNALYDSKKAMAFTCDRPPLELKNFTDRMKNRFQQGLIVDLTIPNFETRLAILRNKSEKLNIRISNDILDLIAEKVTTNVRDLESALTKIAAYAELIGNDITKDVVETQLSYLKGETKPENISIDLIIRCVAEYFNVSQNDIRGKKRIKNIVQARHIAMYIARNLTELSLIEIGNEFGGKDHSTIISAINKVEQTLIVDTTMETVIHKIETKVREKMGKN